MMSVVSPIVGTMSDDEWTVEDDAAVAVAGLGPENPMFGVFAFMSGLSDLEVHRDAMRSVVTPESKDRWGDFAEFAAILESAKPWGLGSMANPSVDAPDVAYAKILPGVTETYQNADYIVTPFVGVFTLVWRPEAGFWMIHHFGDYVAPEFVPRTSPGVAPTY